MQEKILLFCNLNEIPGASLYQGFATYLDKHKTLYKAGVFYNTMDFLCQGIWDLYNGVIDDEIFFQIGDITSNSIVKTPRPYLQGVYNILENLQPHTLYVIDVSARIAYTHINGSRDMVEQKLHQVGSHIYVL